MVLEQQQEHDTQWAAIRSIAEKVGCSGEALRNWVRQAEGDAGQRTNVITSDERARLHELDKEDRELRRANEVLKRASAFFAAELDRPPK